MCIPCQYIDNLFSSVRLVVLERKEIEVHMYNDTYSDTSGDYLRSLVKPSDTYESDLGEWLSDLNHGFYTLEAWKDGSGYIYGRIVDTMGLEVASLNENYSGGWDLFVGFGVDQVFPRFRDLLGHLFSTWLQH